MSVCALAHAVLFSFADDGQARYYCMEAACPHLGAPLESAPLESRGDDEIEDLVVVWYVHRLTQPVRARAHAGGMYVAFLTQQYDFQLSSGESSTGLSSCIYPVDVQGDDVLIGPPTDDVRDRESVWELVEIRPVSEGTLRASRSLCAAPP